MSGVQEIRKAVLGSLGNEGDGVEFGYARWRVLGKDVAREREEREQEMGDLIRE